VVDADVRDAVEERALQRQRAVRGQRDVHRREDTERDGGSPVRVRRGDGWRRLLRRRRMPPHTQSQR
jgi:hypothetical protein